MLYKSAGHGLAGFGFGLVPGGDCTGAEQQGLSAGLVLFLWLPTLVLAWSARQVFIEAWRRQPALWLALLGLLAWSAVTLAWSTAEDDSREAKRLLYILVFLMAFPLLAQAGIDRMWRLLMLGGGLLALAALIRWCVSMACRASHW
jgi:hypothetical protein